ncbi:MAG: hypothetical protein V4584_12315 [Verrucomicrobiota bacterium]
MNSPSRSGEWVAFTGVTPRRDALVRNPGEPLAAVAELFSCSPEKWRSLVSLPDRTFPRVPSQSPRPANSRIAAAEDLFLTLAMLESSPLLARPI